MVSGQERCQTWLLGYRNHLMQLFYHRIYHKHTQLHGMAYNSTPQYFHHFIPRLEWHDGAVMRFQADTDPFRLVREDGLSTVVSNLVCMGQGPNPNVLCWQNRYLSFHSGSESWAPNLQFFNCLIREKKKPWGESFFFFLYKAKLCCSMPHKDFLVCEIASKKSKGRIKEEVYYSSSDF